MQLVTTTYPDAIGLPPYLKSVEKGSTVDLRSPLYGRDTPRESIVRSLPEESIFNCGLPETFLDIERREREKIGPFSIRLPYDERHQQVTQYFEAPKHRYNKRALDQAFEFVARYLDVRKVLRPVTLERVLESSTKSTNWGLPWFQSGKLSSSLHYDMAKDFLQSGELPYYPSVLGWRGQPNGTDKPKQRSVFMYPHYVVLLELMIQMSFLNKYKMHPAFAAWSDDEVINKVITKLLKLPGLKVSFDAKAFDANVIAILITYAFRLLEACFQPGTVDLSPLMKYMITSGLVTPFGTVEGRTGAIPSGSGLTNLIGCLVQLLISAYVCIRSGGDLSTYHITVLGDDGIWYWNGVSKVAVSEFCSELGVDAALEKNFADEDSCLYLQKYHTITYSKRGLFPGVRSVYRTVNGMISYERLVSNWSKYMDSIRWIMQLEQISDHPCHREIVKWAMNGDELGLGHNLKGGVRELAKLAGGAANIAQTLRLESFPHGKRDPRGLTSFATTRVIEEQ